MQLHASNSKLPVLQLLLLPAILLSACCKPCFCHKPLWHCVLVLRWAPAPQRNRTQRLAYCLHASGWARWSRAFDFQCLWVAVHARSAKKVVMLEGDITPERQSVAGVCTSMPGGTGSATPAGGDDGGAGAAAGEDSAGSGVGAATPAAGSRRATAYQSKPASTDKLIMQSDVLQATYVELVALCMLCCPAMLACTFPRTTDDDSRASKAM